MEHHSAWNGDAVECAVILLAECPVILVLRGAPGDGVEATSLGFDAVPSSIEERGPSTAFARPHKPRERQKRTRTSLRMTA